MNLRSLGRTLWPTTLYFAGMGLLLVSERILAEPGLERTWLRIAAAAAITAGLAARIQRATRGSGVSRRFEAWIAVGYAVGGASVGVWALSKGVVASVLWPVLWLGSAIIVIFMEVSTRSIAPGETAHDGRVAVAAGAGLQLVLVLITVVAWNYVASKRERTLDLSFLQETRPSVTVRQLVSRLKEEIEVRVFYPQLHPVRERLVTYFGELRRLNPNLNVAFMDEAIDHAAARKLGVRENGVVVIAKGGQSIQIQLGLSWDEAKRQLDDFDSQIQWAVNKVTRNRTAYFVSGHGEFDTGREVAVASGGQIAPPLVGISLSPRDNALGANRSFRELHKLISAQGYDIAPSPKSGLMTEIPEDAAVVLMMGPRTDLLAEEVEAVRRYLVHGGRLIAFLDPDSGAGEEDLLKPYRLRFATDILANDAVYLHGTSEISDRANLVVTSFSSHPAVMTISRNPNLYRTLFARSGYLEELPEPADVEDPVLVFFTIHAHPLTWADKDNDFEFNPQSEVRKPYELAAVVVGRTTSQTRREFRLMVFADLDVVSDALIGNAGNKQMVVDALTYLGMDEAVPVTLSTRDPIIRRTQEQDKVWFYSVSFGIPVLVLAGGLAGIFRSKRGGGR